MTKISVMGAGQVGATVARGILELELCEELVLFDIVEDMPQGKALDMMETSPILGRDTRLRGTNAHEDIEGSSIVVQTAGFPRKPGMDRVDLLKKNLEINLSVSTAVKNFAPESIFLYVANPLDLMCYAAWKITGFPTSTFGLTIRIGPADG